MKRILFTAFAILLFGGSSFAADVKNVRAQQAGNRVLFEFDVTGDLSPNASIGDEAETEVNITVTVSSKTYTGDKLHLEGDYGKVKVGNGKKLYWNVLQDFPRGLSTTFDWEITAGSNRFQISDLTVLDKETKLMWQKEDDNTHRTWESAIEYCEALILGGYSDWRLPSEDELLTLIKFAKRQGVAKNIDEFLNKIGFNNVDVSYYWSSTTSASYSSYAWSVGFGNGVVYYFSKSVTLYVRCVRGGQ